MIIILTNFLVVVADGRSQSRTTDTLCVQFLNFIARHTIFGLVIFRQFFVLHFAWHSIRDSFFVVVLATKKERIGDMRLRISRIANVFCEMSTTFFRMSTVAATVVVVLQVNLLKCHVAFIK